MASVCTGSILLVECGILDGRKADFLVYHDGLHTSYIMVQKRALLS